uniref:Uncharacterized protein n=1 Tax=Cannabis sativa TaxID=3483 RepID=A0A803P5K0_CANSA
MYVFSFSLTLIAAFFLERLDRVQEKRKRVYIASLYVILIKMQGLGLLTYLESGLGSVQVQIKVRGWVQVWVRGQLNLGARALELGRGFGPSQGPNSGLGVGSSLGSVRLCSKIEVWVSVTCPCRGMGFRF